MSSGPRILLTVSDRPLMYGNVRVVLGGLRSSSAGLGRLLLHEWNLIGVAILLQSNHNSLLLCHTYHTISQ